MIRIKNLYKTCKVAAVMILVLLFYHNALQVLKQKNVYTSQGKGFGYTVSNREELVVRRPHEPQLISEANNTEYVYPWGDVPYQCHKKQYDVKHLHRASIVISFHDNEHLTDIIHTVHSIYKRTPKQLLHEIILVDDFSQKDELRLVLKVYLQTVYPHITVLSTERQEGLIKARYLGIAHATGEVVVILDSHVEVQHRWLEPLLEAIGENQKTLASSCIDTINRTPKGHFLYRVSGSHWVTYFDWNFQFGLQEPGAEINDHMDQKMDNSRSTRPIECPCMVGTAWAMKKSFYQEVGGLDPNMRGWGGENIHLPIKVWLFGGRVVNVPCSHVGHKETVNRSYRYKWNDLIRSNYKRIVDVWMQPYQDFVYEHNAHIQKAKAGNLTTEMNLRHKTFYNFDWYLQNVYPQLGRPSRDDVIAMSGVRNHAFNTCIVIIGTTAALRNCSDRETMLYLSKSGEFRTSVHILDIEFKNSKEHKDHAELAALVLKGHIGMFKSTLNLIWHHEKGGILQHKRSGLCLVSSEDEYNLDIATCDHTNTRHMWTFYDYS